jgi:hypothetical protein
MPPLRLLKATVAERAFDCLEAPMMRIADLTFEPSLPQKCWSSSPCRASVKIVVACIRCCKFRALAAAHVQ